jgi:hypothetical protein
MNIKFLSPLIFLFQLINLSAAQVRIASTVVQNDEEVTMTCDPKGTELKDSHSVRLIAYEFAKLSLMLYHSTWKR